MSNINQLATSNTFSQWLTGTQELISKMNSLTDGGNTLTFYANTNIEIANNLYIGGNTVFGGNVTLDIVGFNDLNVAGQLTVAGNTAVTTVYFPEGSSWFSSGLGALATANGYPSVIAYGSDSHGGPEFDYLDTDDPVGSFFDSNVYRSTMYLNSDGLYVGVNENNKSGLPQAQLTFDEYGLLGVNNGNVSVTGNTTSGNITSNYSNFETANVTTFVGSANTAIYNAISAAAGDGLAFAIALG